MKVRLRRLRIVLRDEGSGIIDISGRVGREYSYRQDFPPADQLAPGRCPSTGAEYPASAIT